MVSWLRLSVAAALLVLALPSRSECGKLVLSADPDYRPLHWYDGAQLRGASIELATRILDDLKVPYEVRYLGPWKRVLASAAAGEIDMVATLKLLPERERYLSYVHTAAFPNPVAVFVDRQQGFVYHHWNDLRDKRGGAAMGNRFGMAFDRFAEDNLQLHESGTVDSNFKKLGLGRIDYLITGLYTGESWLARHRQGQRFMALRPFINEDKNYFAFVKGSPCARHAEAFEARLKELVKSDVNLRILNSHLSQLDIKLDSASLYNR
jgi:polar amino acid transport system substrate-binding protein